MLPQNILYVLLVLLQCVFLLGYHSTIPARRSAPSTMSAPKKLQTAQPAQSTEPAAGLQGSRSEPLMLPGARPLLERATPDVPLVKRSEAFPVLPDLVDPSTDFFSQPGLSTGSFTPLSNAAGARIMTYFDSLVDDVEWESMGLADTLLISKLQPKLDVKQTAAELHEIGWAKHLHIPATHTSWKFRSAAQAFPTTGFMGRIRGLWGVPFEQTDLVSVKSMNSVQLHEMGFVGKLRLLRPSPRTVVQLNAASSDWKELGVVNELVMRWKGIHGSSQQDVE